MKTNQKFKSNSKINLQEFQKRNFQIQELIEDFSQNPPRKDPKIIPTERLLNESNKNLIEIFGKYRDLKKNLILKDGIKKFFLDLLVDPSDIVIYIIFWNFKARKVNELTQMEFVNGWNSFSCQTLEEMKNAIPKFRESVSAIDDFKKFYLYLFSLGSGEPKKVIEIDFAFEIWQKIFSETSEIARNWIKFIDKIKDQIKSITYDTWELTFDFFQEFDSNLNNYDPLSYWPVLIDDFVENFKKNHV
ncbi:dcn1-like protein [Anaeramoeba ignava]|uniref:Defective in cullin neddylation protein n=1 Tax=Anaeramoeba ignava TaxID=1746090 RepID=A0A9Q0LVU9_ANAIG|nr:dcn1-like protein [Anaeramoeba ignava]